MFINNFERVNVLRWYVIVVALTIYCNKAWSPDFTSNTKLINLPKFAS